MKHLAKLLASSIISLTFLQLQASDSIAAQKADQARILKQLQQYGYDRSKLSINSFVKKSSAAMLGDSAYYKDQATRLGAYIKILDTGKFIETDSTGNLIEVGDAANTDGVISPTTPLILQGRLMIHGPVVIDNDIILKNVTVSGTGALFSSRNIHIVGDITSDDQPYYDKGLVEQIIDRHSMQEHTYPERRETKTGSTRIHSGVPQEEWSRTTTPVVKQSHFYYYKPKLYDSIDADGIMQGGIIGQCETNNDKGALALIAKGNIMVGDIRALEKIYERGTTVSSAFNSIPYEIHHSDSANGYIIDVASGLWEGRYDDFDGGNRPGLLLLGNGDAPISKQINNIDSADSIDWSNYVEEGDYIAIYDSNDSSVQFDTNSDVIITPWMIYTVELIAGQSGRLKIVEGLSAFHDSATLKVVVTDKNSTVQRKFFEPTLSEIDILAYSRGTIARESSSSNFISNITLSDYSLVTGRRDETPNNDFITVDEPNWGGRRRGGDGDDIIFIKECPRSAGTRVAVHGQGGSNTLVINSNIFKSSNNIDKITFKNNGYIAYTDFDHVIINDSSSTPRFQDSTFTKIDALLYTNHLLGGRFDDLTIFGSMISQHRKMMGLSINASWDIRARTSILMDYLPIAAEAPKVRYRKEL